MKTYEQFSDEVFEFLLEHENDELYRLALKKSPFLNLEMKELVQQIEGRRIAKKKFPFLSDYKKYHFPRKESLEQASSEVAAIYKTTLIKEGYSFIDLTGGMGIDSYLLGKDFKRTVYVEPQEQLYHSTKYNYQVLGYLQCELIHSTCEAYMQETDEHFDWVYLDPSRRIAGSRKTSIDNYAPNIVELQDSLKRMGDNILVKLSPMQDISECMAKISDIEKIIVLSIDSEIKELLIHIVPDTKEMPTISAVDISGRRKDEFSFDYTKRHIQENLGGIQLYLYQPSPTLVKAELQNRYAERFSLKKAHPNTHLYFSNELHEDYFGRIFLVEKSIRLNKKELRKDLPEMKANVISKNHPLKAKEIYKKYKIKSGGSHYLIAFTETVSGPISILCKRIK